MKNERRTTPYEPPELDIIAFDIEDIITTSGQTERPGNGNGYVGDENEDDNW